MPCLRRVLILGGTGEGAELARRAVDMFAAKADIISSLAGRSRRPRKDIPGRLRIGGFGGIKGLTDYLISEGVDLVVDATHPFAADISAHAYAACIRAEVPRLALIRPPWALPHNARCLELDGMEEAAEILPTISRRAFLTVGGRMEAFSGVERVWFLVRTMDRQGKPPPLADFEQITGRPPFTVENELELMDKYRIDTLVSKHSGGAATCGKIAAALKKNIRIVLIRRPLPEPGEAVATVDQALEWLTSRI